MAIIQMEQTFDLLKKLLVVVVKVYRLGGETDSAIRRRKRTSRDVGERPEEAGC